MSSDINDTLKFFTELLAKIVKMMQEFVDAFYGTVQFGNAANASVEQSDE